MLKDIYTKHFLIGSIFDKPETHRDLLDVGPEHFGAWTPENALKWGPLRPSEFVYDFSIAEQYLAVARDHGMVAHGHTLVWFQHVPDWVVSDQPDRSKMLQRLEQHIHTVGAHFRGRIHSWDVVNEAVSDDPDCEVMWRYSDHQCWGIPLDPWLHMLGPDYVEWAFRFAAEACPDAYLYYNEYFTTCPQDRAVNLTKVAKVCRLVQELRDKGLRVDGIGIQGHWELDSLDLSDVEQMFAMFSQLDITVSISELDIGVRGRWGEPKPPMLSLPTELARQQAVTYARLFRLLTAHSSIIERVSFWGVCDRNTWKTQLHGADYPLLFGVDGKPKEAYHAVADPDGYLCANRGVMGSCQGAS
jgi:endo-1,4-beta-xylanase